MATIQQRGEGQWRVQIRRKGPNGTPVTRARTFETYDAAKRWADVTEGRISGEEYIDKALLLRSNWRLQCVSAGQRTE